MTWTREPPTEAGWYWCRDLPTDPPDMVRVSRYYPTDPLSGEWPGSDQSESLEDRRYPDREWAGPILPPGES